MSLYVRRPVIWSAKDVFGAVKEPHCTITYSQTLGPKDVVPQQEPIAIQVAGTVTFRPIGKLWTAHAFALDDWNNVLHDRHHQLLALGAGTDFEDFQPHVTYQYRLSEEKLVTFHSWNTKFWIVLGPEIVSELPEV